MYQYILVSSVVCISFCDTCIYFRFRARISQRLVGMWYDQEDSYSNKKDDVASDVVEIAGVLLCIKHDHPRFINPFPHNDTFWRPWETSLLKTLWEKEKLLVTSNFSFSHSVFNPLGITFCDFRQIWNCCPQTLSVLKSLKFVVW